VEERGEGLLGRVAREEAPDRGAAVGLGSHGPEGVAGLEGEGFLDGVDRGEVVVFELAELEEAAARQWLAGWSSAHTALRA
jgi:hypothetical protein